MFSPEDPNSDVLQPLALEEWPYLQGELKIEWPKYAHNYYWVGNAIEWKKKEPKLKYNIYCPNGKYDGLFVGIGNYSTFDVYIFCKEENLTLLNEVLIKTQRFDWKKEITFCALGENVVPIVSNALDQLKLTRGVEIYHVLRNSYFRDFKQSLDIKIRLPDGCYLSNLNNSHVEKIHDVWQHKSKNEPELSLHYLQTIIRLNGGLGLFSKLDGSMLSWALFNEWGGLGMVQTAEAHKQKGYAKIIVNAMSEELAKFGKSTVLFIAKGNESSEKMFQSLGFKLNILTTFIVIKKFNGDF